MGTMGKVKQWLAGEVGTQEGGPEVGSLGEQGDGDVHP